jgi:hypothetical protein
LTERNEKEHSYFHSGLLSKFELLHFVDLNELTTGPKGKH